MEPGDELVVIRKEFKLDHHQQHNRREHDGDPDDDCQHPTDRPFLTVPSSGQQLHKRKIAKKEAKRILLFGRELGPFKHLIEAEDIVHEESKVEQQVSVKNKEQQGSHPKERDEWQLDIEQRQLDRSLQEQVRVGHGRYRNRQVSSEGQVSQPEIAAHADHGIEFRKRQEIFRADE